MVTTGLTDTMYANNLRTLRFTVTDEDAGGSPPKDLTSLDLKWALARINSEGAYSTTPVLEKSSDNASEIAKTDPTNGVCEVYLDPADTLALSGEFYFELEVFDPGGRGVVVSTGTLTINRNVVNS